MTSPAQAAREREKKKVALLEDILRRCNGDRWSFDIDGKQMHILSSRGSGESVVLCTIHPDALQDERDLISGALENIVLLLELRRRAIIAVKNGLTSTSPRGGNARQLRDGDFAANAAMLCAEPLFHRFLERRDSNGRHAIHNQEHADKALKRVIGITSKTQLNREERAQTAFIDLRSDFEAWKQRGR